MELKFEGALEERKDGGWGKQNCNLVVKLPKKM